jgi:hypothetical protein
MNLLDNGRTYNDKNHISYHYQIVFEGKDIFLPLQPYHTYPQIYPVNMPNNHHYQKIHRLNRYGDKTRIIRLLRENNNYLRIYSFIKHRQLFYMNWEQQDKMYMYFHQNMINKNQDNSLQQFKDPKNTRLCKDIKTMRRHYRILLKGHMMYNYL